jgi:hypothetical protein
MNLRVSMLWIISASFSETFTDYHLLSYPYTAHVALVMFKINLSIIFHEYCLLYDALYNQHINSLHPSANLITEDKMNFFCVRR